MIQALSVVLETPLSPVTSPSQVLSTPDNLGSHLKNSEAAQRAQLPQRIKPRSPIRDFLNTLQVAPVDMTTPYKKPSAKQNCENLSTYVRYLFAFLHLTKEFSRKK
jgi:hypothetical protein